MTAARTAGHSAKHVASRKHATTRKHNPSGAKTAATRKARVTAKGKHPGHAKARGFAGVGLLPVCTLEAVTMSLRLAGQRVSDDEVAWLWELSGSRELSIAEALAAGARFGLAGMKLAGAAAVPVSTLHPEGLALGGSYLALDPLAAIAGHLTEVTPAMYILGVDVPGPHAVLATPDGWWSWGKLWSPWAATVEEAWAVSWS